MAHEARAVKPALIKRVLVDANILLDVLTDDPEWYDWSAAQLDACAKHAELCINPIVYAEVSVGFQRIEELDNALPTDAFTRLELPWEAGFLAGKAFLQYRRANGARTSPLPDFYIGAHAAIEGMALLTRDAKRYRTYYPKLDLICP
ncbi:MAG: type II toxin-antitoxin system VapC family toxin [Dokdonella sp.]|uniref:type II toxin-antitoxin system VapC family toxin n=1 Tax=Dokdonella sp. TaxID=2291710 RepID=UPI002B530554|nr:type II toxin-antitoxin system VapC family toxin [Dokdonella sp.]